MLLTVRLRSCSELTQRVRDTFWCPLLEKSPQHVSDFLTNLKHNGTKDDKQFGRNLKQGLLSNLYELCYT